MIGFMQISNFPPNHANNAQFWMLHSCIAALAKTPTTTAVVRWLGAYCSVCVLGTVI